jgi:hypothetical protein
MRDDGPTLLNCGLCGDGIPGKDPRPGWYRDGEDITCDCGAVNTVSLDSETDQYVGSWTCKHGKDDETMCDLCETEESGAP